MKFEEFAPVHIEILGVIYTEDLFLSNLTLLLSLLGEFDRMLGLYSTLELESSIHSRNTL